MNEWSWPAITARGFPELSHHLGAMLADGRPRSALSLRQGLARRGVVFAPGSWTDFLGWLKGHPRLLRLPDGRFVAWPALLDHRLLTMTPRQDGHIPEVIGRLIQQRHPGWTAVPLAHGPGTVLRPGGGWLVHRGPSLRDQQWTVGAGDLPQDARLVWAVVTTTEGACLHSCVPDRVETARLRGRLHRVGRTASAKATPQERLLMALVQDPALLRAPTAPLDACLDSRPSRDDREAA